MGSSEWVTGHWIETYSGRRVDPINPDPSQIIIEDIAHSLSLQCRFTGHCKEFYSVGQHSVLVARILPLELALWGLLHDASEAYLSDLSRPIKVQPAFKAVYGAAEDNLMSVIARKFGLMWPMPIQVREADDAILRAEARDLLPNSQGWWREGGVPHPDPIIPLEPSWAEMMFLELFDQLTK